MKTISRILIFAMLHLCWFTSYSYAEMVSTESAVEQPSTSNTDRQRLLDLLDRQEVIDELQKYGVSKVEAVVRINSLTDEEITKIAGKLDELSPAGFIPPEIAVPILLMVLTGVFYVAFLPFAAAVCVFVEDPWSDCMCDYWEFYANLWGIKKAPIENECTRKCDDQWTSCIGSKEYNEEFLEIRRQCNIDNTNCLKFCQTGEGKEICKEGEQWFQRPDTNEWIPCEEQQE